MRIFAKLALSLAVVTFVASVSLAQGRPGGPGGMGPQGGPNLLLNKSVQEELKLTDAQKADLKKVADTLSEARTKAVEESKGDRQKMQEAMKAVNEQTTKSLTTTIEGLKPEQAKRFKQIEVQVAGIRALTGEDDVAKEVQKTLKLTDAQKDEIKAQAKDLQKDIQEITKDIPRGDAEKRTEANKKVAELNKQAMDKISKSLTAEQQKTWKELTGEKFDIKFEGRPGATPPAGSGKSTKL